MKWIEVAVRIAFAILIIGLLVTLFLAEPVS
jgi:hypothetical protein